jgi:DNA-binding IclR family transcriptional regulator
MPTPRGAVQSVGRALELLTLLGKKAPEGVRVTAAARLLGVDPGTASRLLMTLVSQGYASKLSDRSYTVGVRSLRLATEWFDALLASATPHLQRVSEATGGTVQLFHLLSGEAVAIARMAPGGHTTGLGEGDERYPLWSTAAGHALLAVTPPTERVRALPPQRYPAFTPRTPTTWAQLSAVIERGVREGVFVEDGQYDPDHGCAAAPLGPSGRGEALALAVSYRLDDDERHKALVRRAVAREAHILSFAV